MVLASELRPATAIRIESQVYRVLEVESRAGAAKMGGVVRVKLSNVRSGRLWEHHFRPQERVEDLELQRRRMAFLYSDGTSCVFQRLDTFDQVEIPVVALGTAEKFLQPGIEIPVEFFQEEPIHVVLPDVVECRVATTTPPMRSQPDSGRKEATLENGLSLQVPLFVAPGETVRVDVKTGRYVERVRMEHKKGA
jgi:elongation factor P